MVDNGYVCLDTRDFDKAILKKSELISAYKEINEEYEKIMGDLMNNWKGSGAAAFEKDAKTVRSNLVSVFDIIKIMCDTLSDCRDVFAECDKALGEYNKSPNAK